MSRTMAGLSSRRVCSLPGGGREVFVEFCLEIKSTWTWSEVELLLVDQHQVAVPLWRSPDMSPRPTWRERYSMSFLPQTEYAVMHANRNNEAMQMHPPLAYTCRLLRHRLSLVTREHSCTSLVPFLE
jgi:hypothetical protein